MIVVTRVKILKGKDSYMAVTLKQIAERAGVSIPTASRILNGRGSGVQVREETRQRVLNVAAELGYKPNLLARGLVGGKSLLIGVIVRDIADPFLNKVLKGMYEAAIENNYRLFLGHVSQQTDTTVDYGSMFEQSHADGIIVMGDMRDDGAAIQALTDQHHYVVGVTDRIDRREFPGVYCDSADGSKQAMEHLLGRGHRRIACVTDRTISDGSLRANIYEQVMRDHDADKYIQVYETSRSIENGYQLGLELLEGQPQFTAIFAVTDTLAIGLLKAAFQRGVTVPEQLSLIGYDDIDLAPYTNPSLTTISQCGHEMGYATTELLIDMIENERDSSDVEDVVLTPYLIIRETTDKQPINLD